MHGAKTNIYQRKFRALYFVITTPNERWFAACKQQEPPSISGLKSLCNYPCDICYALIRHMCLRVRIQGGVDCCWFFLEFLGYPGKFICGQGAQWAQISKKFHYKNFSMLGNWIFQEIWAHFGRPARAVSGITLPPLPFRIWPHSLSNYYLDISTIICINKTRRNGKDSSKHIKASIF